MSTKLSLRVLRVKCVDETGGKFAERIGNDEIWLGGFAVNEKGTTTGISPVSIYPHFDDGDVKTFNPPMVFSTIQLPAASQWKINTPFTFGVGLILIEKDNGGKEAAVNQITKKADQFIKEKLAEFALLPTPTIPTKIDWSVVLKWLASVIIPWVIKHVKAAFSDEIFAPQVVSINIPNPAFKWLGSSNSAEKTVRFNDHSGIYELTYDWLLS